MQEIKGNLFDPAYAGSIKCVTTNAKIKANGNAVMGAGLALAVAEAYPEVSKTLADHLVAGHNTPVYLGHNWVSFPTKDDWKDPSTIELIVASANHIVMAADRNSDIPTWQKIYLPRVGCGLGGLAWADVHAKLDQLFDDRFTIVY